MSIFGFDDMMELYADLDDDKVVFICFICFVVFVFNKNIFHQSRDLNVEPGPHFFDFPEAVLQCIISHSDLRCVLHFIRSFICLLMPLSGIVSQ